MNHNHTCSKAMSIATDECIKHLIVARMKSKDEAFRALATEQIDVLRKQLEVALKLASLRGQRENGLISPVVGNLHILVLTEQHKKLTAEIRQNNICLASFVAAPETRATA